MNTIALTQRFVAWVIDRMAFVAVASVVLVFIHQLDRLFGFSSSKSVGLNAYDLLGFEAPVSVLVTYVVWMLILFKIGPPGRILTRTDVQRHRGGNAGWVRKAVRAVIKIALHLTIIGLVIDAVFIIRDRAERRSIPDILAGTVITGRRR